MRSLLNSPMLSGAQNAYTSLSTNIYFPKSKDFSKRGAAKEMSGFTSLSQRTDGDRDQGTGFHFVLKQNSSRLTDMHAKSVELARDSNLSEIAPEFEAGFWPVSVATDYLNGSDGGRMGGVNSEANSARRYHDRAIEILEGLGRLYDEMRIRAYLGLQN